MVRKIVFAFVFLLSSVALFAQNSPQTGDTLQIQIIHADEMKYSKAMKEDVVRLIGNTVCEHEGALLYCDSAWLDQSNNSVECFGKVHVKSSDTLNLYGKYASYDGNTRICHIKINVKLIDRQTTLTTDSLIFDRNTQIASYTTGGKIVNKENTLTSRKGYYHTNIKEFFFRDDVKLTNPDYRITSDTLRYNTLSRVSYFLGPSHIYGKDTYIYCENGEYNTVSDFARFSKNNYFVNGSQTLKGDSLVYDSNAKFGKAFRNITLTDTTQNVVSKGNYAEYWKNKGYALITDRAQALLGDEKDTLYLHADTLKATFDTLPNGDTETRDIFAFHHVRFFRTDLQGLCDSLHYGFADSLITLVKGPVLWHEKNQITGDTIRILTGKNTVKQVDVTGTSFIISVDSTDTYNQLKGRNMLGRFVKNQLATVDVFGNAEEIYYYREESKELVGIWVGRSSTMRIYFDSIGKIYKISHQTDVEGKLNPEEELAPDKRVFPGFQWLDKIRPKDRTDIFRRKEEI